MPNFPRINTPMWLAEAVKNRTILISVSGIIAVLAMVAVFTTGPATTSLTTSPDSESTEAQGPEGEGVSPEDVVQSAEEAAVSPGGRPTDRYFDNPRADVEFARAIGATIKPQSTSLPGGNPNTWVGVTKDTIKAVFSYDEANCGVNTITAISQAGAQTATATRFYRKAPGDQQTANRETRESIDALVKVFNRRGLEVSEQFPQIRPLMGNDPERPFFGRRLIYELIDGGSFQCPEKTTAAAVEIVEQRKPFVVFNNFDGTQANMADALNAKAPDPKKRPMHFGTLWLSDTDYTRWSPFVWTQFNSGTRAVELYASWVCSRVVGKNATNSVQWQNEKRKFALLYPNLQHTKTVAGELKAYLQQFCGADIIQGREFAYAPDPSRAADEGTTIGVRLKVERVTSVMYLHDPLFPIFQLPAWEGQDYRPELVFTPTGYYDAGTVQRIYASLSSDKVDKRAFGITQFGVPGGFGYEAGDAFWAWHDTHKVSPNTKKPCDPSSDAGMNHDENYCKAPSGIVTWYYTTLPLLGGTIFAGPDLNPTHVSTGLQQYPKIRYGTAGPTDDPRPAGLGSGPGKHYFIIDGLEWRYRHWYVSPPPESKLGWVEYPDCQRHYLLWPNQYAVNWEPDGLHFSAWCGDAKYAPPDIPGCSNAPGGRCARDGYPRWGAENCWKKGTC